MNCYIKFLSIILSITFLSCKRDNNRISDSFKLKVLNEILTDTTDLRLLDSTNQLIARFPFGSYWHIDTTKKAGRPTLEYISHSKYIGKRLNEDTIYIKNQLKANKNFDLIQLKEYGFQIEDNSIMLDSLKDGDIEVSAYNLYFWDNVTSIFKPVFNRKKDELYLQIVRDNYEYYVILRKDKNGKWFIKTTDVISY